MAKRGAHTVGLSIGTSRVTCIIGEPGDRDFTVLTDVLQRWEPQPISTLEAGTGIIPAPPHS